MPLKDPRIQKEEEESQMDPTVLRLSNELKEEKGAARALKKNWRQSQAEHMAASVEVERLTKELGYTQKALNTTQEIQQRLEKDLSFKQTQFMDSDVRASSVTKELMQSQLDLAAENEVNQKFTGDLLKTREQKDKIELERKGLSEDKTRLKSEVLNSRDVAEKATLEVKQARVDVERYQKAEKEAIAQTHYLSREQKIIMKEMIDVKKDRDDIDAYAQKMREDAAAAKKKLEIEQAITKKLTEQLKESTAQHLDERDKAKRLTVENKAETLRTVGLRKDKIDIENVARGVQRDRNAFSKKNDDQEHQLGLLQNCINGNVADIAAIQKKLKDSEANAKQLAQDLQVARRETTEVRDQRDSVKEDYKQSSDETKIVRKEVKDERSTCFSVVRELQGLRKELIKCNAHAEDCERVITGMTADLKKEQTKFFDSQAVVKSLNEKVKLTEKKVEKGKEREFDLGGVLQATAEELSLERRTAKDAGTAIGVLTNDIRGVKVNLRGSSTDVVRLEETLETFRKNLFTCEANLGAEKGKVVKLTSQLEAMNQQNKRLDNVIVDKGREIASWEEQLHLCERRADGHSKMTESVAFKLSMTSKSERISQVELSTVTESAERYMKRIEHLEKQLKEADEEKERLKQKIHANLVRAEGAESLNHGHEKTVADWEEKAAVAERHDQNHSALTVKMAHKLYEAKGALPPMEQAVGAYKDQVERLVSEITKLEAEMPKVAAENKRVTQAHGKSQAFALKCEAAAEAANAKVPPLKEKILFLEAQLGDEEAFKREIVKELNKNRKRATEAEDQVKELAGHIDRLIFQLKSDGKPVGKERSPRSPKGSRSPKGERSPRSPKGEGGRKGDRDGAPLRSLMGGVLKKTESLPSITKKNVGFGM